MLLDDMIDYLTSQGAVTTGAVFMGYMPDEPSVPDACVAVYETGGFGPVMAMHASASEGVALERPRVQVVVRGGKNEYQSARAQAEAVKRLLNGLPRRAINGTTYYWGQAVQEPFSMGRDKEQRPLIACNFDISKARTTST